MPDHVIEVDPRRIVEIDARNQAVEIDASRKIIETTRRIQYAPNKMVFVVGTTNGTAVSVGDKQTYGTRFLDGSIKKYVVTTNAPTTLSVSIQRSSSFPVFSEILPISMTDQDYVSGDVDIPLNALDILNIVFNSNDIASKVTVELYVR